MKLRQDIEESRVEFMGVDLVFRIALIIAGLFLMLCSFMSLVKRKMTEGIALGWAVGAVILIVIGAVPSLTDWIRKLSTTHLIELFLLSAFIVGFVYRISSIISQLTMKNQELAMQVSLLNQENERILHEIELLTGKSKVDI